MIPLVKNTISNHEIDLLADWLRGHPRLTKGELTLQFEDKWSDLLGCNHSVFVNSGSSANLLMLYSLIESGEIERGNKVVVPAVSWATDLAPVCQLGLEPILCDCNLEDLSVDLNFLEDLMVKNRPKVLMFVSVLGLVPEMDKVVELCDKYGVILLEDACESIGSSCKGKSLGTFGLMSSFSTYFGHHFSTIEGGIVCTNDDDTYNMLKSLRSHGWDRDTDEHYRKKLRKDFFVSDDFDSLYKFYMMGFNLRSTDLNAFIGINQLDNFNSVIETRNNNYNLYHELITCADWKPHKSSKERFVSNFAYPMISRNRHKIVDKLVAHNVETRPLICGSLGKQPFWIKNYGVQHLPNADIVNDCGFYLPNNIDITEEEIKFVCSLVEDA
jgi:CDP-4-dehydro-6-deoxyglucose reductase, E1